MKDILIQKRDFRVSFSFFYFLYLKWKYSEGNSYFKRNFSHTTSSSDFSQIEKSEKQDIKIKEISSKI